MDLKVILQTAAGVAIGMILAGIVSGMLNKNEAGNFDNE